MKLLLLFAIPLVMAQSEPKSSPDYFRKLQEVQRLFVHAHWIGRSLPDNLTAQCTHDLFMYLDQLQRGNTLALQISDSSGRYQGGALLVNEFWLGSKTLCQEVNQQLDVSANISRVHFSVTRMTIKFEPMYPTISLMKKNNNLAIGQCLPASCLENDVLSILATDPAVLALQSKLNQTDQLEVLSSKLVPGSYDIFSDKKFIMACRLTGGLITLVVFATVYEASITLERKKLDETEAAKPESQWWVTKFILCFAIGANARTILSLDPANDQSFTCIHGLRTFSLIWTVLGHTGLMLYTVGANRALLIRETHKFYFQVSPNGHYAVDTFFFLSSFLVVTLFLKKYKNSGSSKTSVQWVKKAGMLIFYRYGRLTPVYLLILLYSELGMKFAYNQSVFPNNPDLLDHVTCEKYWWRNALYINNLFGKDEICMIWSWFLANEMQFYVMATVLLIVSLKHFKVAITLLVGFLLSSWVISAILSLSHGYKYRLLFPLEAFDYLYEKPWNRIGAYIVGMITGGIFDHYRTPPRIPHWLNLSLWVVSLGILFGLVFGLWIPEMSIAATATFVSLGRTLWSCGLVWVMLSCCWGLAPPVNEILSWKVWIPLSRLTYCSYLIHPLLQVIFYHMLETPIPLNQITLMTIYAGTLLLTYTIALCFSLLLEAPTIRVMRLLIKK